MFEHLQIWTSHFTGDQPAVFRHRNLWARVILLLQMTECPVICLITVCAIASSILSSAEALAFSTTRSEVDKQLVSVIK